MTAWLNLLAKTCLRELTLTLRGERVARRQGGENALAGS
jgi:hypothetical protein